MRWVGALLRSFGIGVTAAFDASPRPIDQMFLELRGRGTSVSREQALTVPAVLKGRNRICSLATLPLVEIGPDNRPVDNPLLRQIDPNVPNVTTLAQTLEDLLFEAVAWWRILDRRADQFPSSATRVDPSRVSLDPPSGGQQNAAPLPSGLDPRNIPVVWIDGRPVLAQDVIRFDSPNPALRVAGARAIRKAIRYDEAAAMYAANPSPQDYFTPSKDSDPISDDDAREAISGWRAARKSGGTGYVPASLTYNPVASPSAADMKLPELIQQCTLEIANALGLDPEVLGVSTTSRTYANAQDWRQDRINDVYAPYMAALAGRLSMGDVTRRGYRVEFDLDDYMRANPTERWGVYRTAMEIGVMDAEDIRAREGLPPGAPTGGRAPAPAAVPAAAPGDELARRRAAATFAGDERMTFDAPVIGFNVDEERREISGLAVPYGAVGSKGGLKFRFAPGALEWHDEVSRVKMLQDHDFVRAVGHAVHLANERGGLAVKFKIKRGPAGDEALGDAADKVKDGMSVGIDFDMATDVEPDPDDESIILIRRATLREVSLTALPAFDDARVTSVAASRNGGTMITCPTCQATYASGSTHACQSAPAPAPAAAVPAGGGPGLPAVPGLSTEQVTAAFNAMVAALAPVAAPPVAAPNAGPAFVDPRHGTALTAVNEPSPYRFDRKGNLVGGTHHFGIDVVSALGGGQVDGLERAAAHDRVLEFVRAQFDVITTDVNELNPNRNVQDMYVDQREFRYPVWDAISKGTLTDITPFLFPKFSSASGLVGAHTEGTEPSSGTLVTTSQTVTPVALSGKAKLSREVWDQGGNPQVSALIWRQMLRGWYEALEAAGVAVLDAATPTAIALTAGAADDALDGELTAALAGLHFIRGGFSMDAAFTQIDLYKKLIAAVDADGRRLYPAIGPANATGTVANRFGAIDVNGVTFLPAWALAASGSVVASSYLFDRAVVHGWASTPQRLTIDQTEVANVYIGLFGYRATAISDVAGVREITYDPVA